MVDTQGKGLLSFADAIEAARSDIAAATATSDTEVVAEAATTEGAVADQVAADVLEHPEAVAEAPQVDEPFMFEDVYEDLAPTDYENANTKDIRQEVVVDERLDGPMTVEDLINGNLMRADYTRKTQQLSEDRKQFAQENAAAAKLMSALKENPAGTIASLAVSVGLLQENQLDAATMAQINREHRVPSREEVDQQVEAKAKALLETDPRIQEAEDARLMREVETQFSSIESDHGVKFSQRDKQAILEHAVKMETMRIDLAYLDLKERADRLRSQRQAAQQTAPQAPQSGKVEDSTSTQPSTPPKTVREAWQRAKAQAASN